jgi:uncharacterized protein (TIGR03435 family)
MPLLTAAGLLAVATPVVFGLLHAAQSPAESQAETTPAMALVFEVASIKPDKYSSRMFKFGWYSPETFTATGATLQILLREAYGVENNQISGAPNWADSKRYDIQAKADKSVAEELGKGSLDQRTVKYQRMLQSLLVDRFKLTLHRETKELPVYELVIAKHGPKLEEAKPGNTYPNGIGGPGSHSGPHVLQIRSGQLVGQALPMADLARLLTRPLGRTVLDKTGLTGDYDFKLQWTPDENQLPMLEGTEGGPQGAGSARPPDSTGPSMFTAIQEQLGLKLESKKGPVEVLVIDHVEEPSEN